VLDAETKRAKGHPRLGLAGDAAEEAAVQARPPTHSADAIRTNQKPGAGRARAPAKPGGGKQLTDDDYGPLARQQYESHGEIEIDPHSRVSRSDTGAWVQGWVFVDKAGRR
jgi:hypothetical protein